MTPLESLIQSGTKLWLDSVDPQFVEENLKLGATGATSNPSIVSDIIKTGKFDDRIEDLIRQGLDDETIAWRLTDRLVADAQQAFLPVWERTHGDDGYVSFELEPLLEDVDCKLTTAERAQEYIRLGRQWSAGHKNRMIKVPATAGGLAALEEMSAAGITLNVTLIFSERQYQIARDAVWKGAQRRSDPRTLKSVYSIFVSRIDVYTEKHCPDLSPAAQGQVAVLNAKRIWQLNQSFWRDKGLPRRQEIVFASMGTKKPEDPKDRYVAALAGSDIQTNPPETNDAVRMMTGRTYQRTVDQFPAPEAVAEIDAKVDFAKMEQVLMDEGLAKFAQPHKALIALIAAKRRSLG